MRTGKLSISRGSHFPEGRPHEPKLSLVGASPLPAATLTAGSAAIELQPIQNRLDALERLARLRAQEILSREEFAAEKALILGRPVEGSNSRRRRVQETGDVARPSLIGRLLSWKFLPIGLVAGIALSFGAQPQETMRFFDQALRLVGA